MLGKKTLINLTALMAALFLFAGPARAADWIASADVSWYEANSADVTFTIKTAEELAGLAKLVNDKTELFKGKTVSLAADIDLAGKVWTPIGYKNRFQGAFDGCNHVINLKTVRIMNTPTGLFGFLDSAAGCSVKNLEIVGDIGFIRDDSYSAESDFRFGPFVGELYGNIENCVFRGNITISGLCTYAGGIVGFTNSNTKVLNCHAYANIMNDSEPYQSIYSIYYTFRLGGIAGMAGGAVENCYFQGSIKYKNDSMVIAAGGIIGGTSTGTSAALTNCVASADLDVVTGKNDDARFDSDGYLRCGAAGGIAGYFVNSNMYGCTATGTISINSSSDNVVYAAGGIVGIGTKNFNASALDCYIEHCISTATVTAHSGKAGTVAGVMIKVDAYGIHHIKECEYLAHSGAEIDPVGSGYDANQFQISKVTDPKDFLPASVALSPIIRLNENNACDIAGQLFPTNAGKNGDVSWIWNAADSEILKVTAAGAKAVVKGIATGFSALRSTASGFLGENMWGNTANVSVSRTMLTSLRLSAENIKFTKAGDSAVITASITPDSGASYPVLRWTYDALTDNASRDDIELNYISGSLSVEITLKKYVEGARYLIKAATVDGSGLEESVGLSIASGDAPQPENSGSGGGCDSGVGMAGVLLMAVFASFGRKHS